jgi:orotidine-5'-phosphate decarboxylase
MNNSSSKLIVALDVGSFEEAKKFIIFLKDAVEIFKVGSQLFTASGPSVIQYLLEREKKVFLDLKFHDIPNTVASAMESAANLGVFMCSLHIMGGKEMLERAVDSSVKKALKNGIKKPLNIGITVLTSDQKADNINNIVLERAKLAKEAGLDGIVASAQEASLIRQELGKDFIIVTPGIRLKGADSQDQKRVTTPFDAISNGSDYLVVGRPIIQSEDPLLAAKEILKEIKNAENSH